MKERNHYLDNIKAICTISVVFIHTVFWSGGNYVPSLVRNLSLLIDVPVFFLITGLISGYRNKTTPLIQVVKLSLMFTTFLLLSQIVTLSFNAQDLLKSLFLYSFENNNFIVSKGSYWFVTMYCISLTLASLLLRSLWISISFIFISATYYFITYILNLKMNTMLLGIFVNDVPFYTSLILIGFLSINQLGNRVWIAPAFLSLSYIIYTYASEPLNLQANKFPVQLPYVASSMLSLSLVMLFSSWKEKNIITFIGKDSLYYYMSQGIGSSLIYYFTVSSNLPWPVKLLTAFSMNMVITIALGLILKQFFSAAIRFVKILKFNKVNPA